MNGKWWRGTALAVMALASFAASPAIHSTQAATGCDDKGFHWSDGSPRLNLRHIFCGEIKNNGDPVGLHSKAMAATSPIIAGIDAKPAGPDGLYGATVRFSNGREKFSSFFPDRCSSAQIEKSIRFAASNKYGDARPWGFLGCSAPKERDEGYCVGDDGKRLVIRYGTNRDGDINTAFPLIGQDCP
ncbi:EndoU domain-containing protein [Niveispirillum irakense]|uniref:EndoU domain-containing protein n=1 Tax=Niveispirillum irakense TaxID=34011 RepID=UPI00041CD659|nr:EndoU domain-containing protein [Niveispirillum irakense]